MSIQPTNVQGNQNVSQVNTSATQETNQVQNPVPAQLGESHSIGKTLSRCFASIQTAFANFGTYISNLFSSKAEVAPAMPNLPQNFDKMSYTEMSRFNNELADKVKNNDNTIMPQIDKAFKEVSQTLSDFSSLDKGKFLERLAQEIKYSNTAISDTKLFAFSRKIAGQCFATNIAMNFMEQHPEAHKVPEATKGGFATSFTNNTVLKTIVEAQDPKAIGTLLPILKEELQCGMQSVIDSKSVQKELCELGQSMFTQQTGLGADVKVNSTPIENKMNIMKDDINNAFATAEKPYLKADKAALKAGWEGKVKEYYADRATAYNSISTLGLPENISTNLKKICVTSNDKINPQLFVYVNTISNEVIKSGKIQELINSKLTPEDLIKNLTSLADLVHQKITDVVGLDQLKKMGVEEKGLVDNLVMDLLLHPEKSELGVFGKNNTDTLQTIHEQLDDSIQVMRFAENVPQADFESATKAYLLLGSIIKG